MFNKENKKPMAADNSLGGSNRIIAGTIIKGEVNSASDFRIDGEIEGNITTTGRLVVGKDGIIRGEVICANADVEGTIIAKSLIVKGTLSLKSTANIQGTVQAEKLAIEPGAIFTVTCSMGGASTKTAINNEPIKKESK